MRYRLDPWLRNNEQVQSKLSMLGLLFVIIEKHCSWAMASLHAHFWNIIRMSSIEVYFRKVLADHREALLASSIRYLSVKELLSSNLGSELPRCVFHRTFKASFLESAGWHLWNRSDCSSHRYKAMRLRFPIYISLIDLQTIHTCRCSGQRYEIGNSVISYLCSIFVLALLCYIPSECDFTRHGRRLQHKFQTKEGL